MAKGGSQEVSNDPWAGVQPYLTHGFQYALRDVLDRPLEFFPNSTVTPFSPETQYGLGATTSRALGGSPLNPAAQGQIMDTLGGNYLAGGEGYDAYLDSVLSSVRPNVESQFAASGRSGSPLMGEALGRGIGRGMAPLYNAERSRMMQASAMAPQLAREDYYDIDRLMGVGAKREDLYSRELADQMGRWDFAQQEPGARTGQYMNLLQGGLPFGTQRTSGGGKGSTLGMGLGGALGLAPLLMV
jgi:hypothetical protein